VGGLTLEDGSEVDGGTGTDSLGVVASLEETVDTTDRDWSERGTRRGRPEPNSHWRPALDDREEDLDSAPDFPPLPPEDIVDIGWGWLGWGVVK